MFYQVPVNPRRINVVINRLRKLAMGLSFILALIVASTGGAMLGAFLHPLGESSGANSATQTVADRPNSLDTSGKSMAMVQNVSPSFIP